MSDILVRASLLYHHKERSLSVDNPDCWVFVGIVFSHL